MGKRKPKVPVPPEEKGPEYYERRKRNTIYAMRSREKKRKREELKEKLIEKMKKEILALRERCSLLETRNSELESENIDLLLNSNLSQSLEF